MSDSMELLSVIRKVVSRDAPRYWGGTRNQLAPSDLQNTDPDLIRTISRAVAKEAPKYRTRQPTADDIASMGTEDLNSVIKKCVAEEALRNPPKAGGPPPPGGIDEEYLCELIRRIISEEFRPDPQDPFLRAAIKQVLAEESEAVEEKHAQIAFEQAKTMVPPDEAKTSDDRNQIDFYVRNPGTGAFVLATVMIVYGIYPKEAKGKKGTKDDSEKAYEDPTGDEEMVQGSNMPVGFDDAEEGGDDASKDVSLSIGGQVQKTILKIISPLSPLILVFGQFVFVVLIFRDANDKYHGGTCPGLFREYNEGTDGLFEYNETKSFEEYNEGSATISSRIMMSFISAYFVVKNTQTLFAYLSALKSRATPPNSTSADDSRKIKDIRESWIYPLFALDCLFNLTLTYGVLLCNLYTVFVSAVAPKEMLTRTVVLNFVFEQLPNFKKSLLDGDVGKGILAGLKQSYTQSPQNVAWKGVCVASWNVVPIMVRVLSAFPILLSIMMIGYGPVCKPGPYDIITGLIIKKNGGQSAADSYDSMKAASTLGMF